MSADTRVKPVPMLDLSPQLNELWDEFNAAVQRVLRSNQFVLGEEVRAFEEEVARYLGVKHAVGLNSGTDALLIGLRALGVGPGDEVVTPSFSFFATAEAISFRRRDARFCRRGRAHLQPGPGPARGRRHQTH